MKVTIVTPGNSLSFETDYPYITMLIDDQLVYDGYTKDMVGVLKMHMDYMRYIDAHDEHGNITE